MRKSLFIGCVFLFSSQVSTSAPYADPNDNDIRQVIQQSNRLNPASTWEQRLTTISQYFVGRPYKHQPLGEGKSGRFDTHPTYRTDGFDCLTYVETVLALAHSHDLASFKKHLTSLRYHHGKIGFLNRNHFTSVDWNPHNTQGGWVADITHQFVDKKGQPIAEIAEATIDKPAWIRHFQQLPLNLSPELKKQRVAELHKRSHQRHAEKSVMLFLPLTKLLGPNGQGDATILSQLPSFAIIELIRPNWDLRPSIGSHINVSHLGFLLKKENRYYLRHASSMSKKVVTVPLIAYLKKQQRNDTIKGISVLTIQPKDFR